jgi:hypothetical protein
MPFLQTADSTGTERIEMAHTSVQEHQPAARLHKAFQCVLDFFLNFRLKNLPVAGKRAYKLLIWHLIILAKRKKRNLLS